MGALDLLGVAEVADLLGTSAQNVTNMRVRGKLPEPDAVLRCGPIWQRSTIEDWCRWINDVAGRRS